MKTFTKEEKKTMKLMAKDIKAVLKLATKEIHADKTSLKTADRTDVEACKEQIKLNKQLVVEANKTLKTLKKAAK